MSVERVWYWVLVLSFAFGLGTCVGITAGVTESGAGSTEQARVTLPQAVLRAVANVGTALEARASRTAAHPAPQRQPTPGATTATPMKTDPGSLWRASDYDQAAY